MSRGLLALAMLGLLGGGCATVKQAMDSIKGSAESPAAPAQHTADGKAAAYRAQAAQHERRGELRPAVEAWMTAVALTPEHEPSRVQLKRVRAQLDHELGLRLQRGWQAVARDANAEARQEFVAALALDPYSKSAHEGLRALAAPSPAEARPAPTRPAPPPPARASVPAPERNGKPEVLYGVAKAHLAEGRDEEAYRALAHLERLNAGYADSPQLLSEVRQRLVRQRYQDGLKLFREERLEDAIDKWRGVLELDPRHPHARRNIEQAEKMLRTLAAQQKSNR
jgi:tetratricopeptide (TPR) repeat protein